MTWLGTGLALLLAAFLPPALPSGTAASQSLSPFSVPPAEAERRLSADPFRIVAARRTRRGVMGARRLDLRFADGLELGAKWKTAPRDKAEGWNNSPRNEVATYEIQKLFLDPKDFVVPPTAARCIPLDAFAPIGKQTQPTIEDTGCVYGALSLWLRNVAEADPIHDEARFAQDLRYAYHLANMNLVSYLVRHGDGRGGNYLISLDPSDPRVFSVDNGIVFGTFVRNWFSPSWSRIRVAALPRVSVARLRSLTDEALAALSILGELEADVHGVLRPVTPGENLDPSTGTRIAPGRIQFGLRVSEIQALRERVDALLARVDAGRIGLFRLPPAPSPAPRAD